MRDMIIDCIGKIDDEIIMEADSYKKEKVVFTFSPKLILTFACAMLLMIPFISSNLLVSKKSNGTFMAEYATETAEEAMALDSAAIAYYEVKVRVIEKVDDKWLCEVLSSDNSDITGNVYIVTDEELEKDDVKVIAYSNYEINDETIIYSEEIYEED